MRRKLKPGDFASGPGDLEGGVCNFLPDIIYASWKHFFRAKTSSMMRSFGFWSQFDCENFLLEVQKKAAYFPKGRILKQSGGTM